MVNFYKIFNRLSVYFAYIFNDRHHCFEVKLLSSRGVFSVTPACAGMTSETWKSSPIPQIFFLHSMSRFLIWRVLEMHLMTALERLSE